MAKKPMPSFEAWKKEVEKILPAPDHHEVMLAIEFCGYDRPRERIKMLKALRDAHEHALAAGTFNDE